MLTNCDKCGGIRTVCATESGYPLKSIPPQVLTCCQSCGNFGCRESPNVYPPTKPK